MVVSATFGFSPDPPRMNLFESAQSRLRVLKDVNAPLYAPALYAEYIRAVELAGGELADQQKIFYGFRQYLTFERLCGEALERADAAERDARENRAAVQIDVVQGRHQLREMISGIRAGLDRTGISNAGRGGLVRAEVLLREAEIMSDAGRWLEARQKMEGAFAAARAADYERRERMSRFNDPQLIDKWDRWARETIHGSAQHSTKAILVVKSRNVCLLLDSGSVVRRYAADLGKNSAYDKSYRGDEATPEGKYKIIEKKGLGRSKFHKALLINYPNDEDVRSFRRSHRVGHLLPQSRLGGLIEIHGDGGRDKNWTQGCVALHNTDMDDLYSRVGPETPVTIVGNYSDFDLLAPGSRAGQPRESAAVEAYGATSLR